MLCYHASPAAGSIHGYVHLHKWMEGPIAFEPPTARASGNLALSIPRYCCLASRQNNTLEVTNNFWERLGSQAEPRIWWYHRCCWLPMNEGLRWPRLWAREPSVTASTLAPRSSIRKTVRAWRLNIFLTLIDSTFHVEGRDLPQSQLLHHADQLCFSDNFLLPLRWLSQSINLIAPVWLRSSRLEINLSSPICWSQIFA